MWNNTFKRLPTKWCTAVGTNWRLVVDFDITTQLLSLYQSKGKGCWNFLFLQQLKRVYMVALRGDETNCE